MFYICMVLAAVNRRKIGISFEEPKISFEVDLQLELTDMLCCVIEVVKKRKFRNDLSCVLELRNNRKRVPPYLTWRYQEMRNLLKTNHIKVLNFGSDTLISSNPAANDGLTTAYVFQYWKPYF